MFCAQREPRDHVGHLSAVSHTALSQRPRPGAELGQQSTRPPGGAPATLASEGASSATPAASRSPTGPACCSEAYDVRDIGETVKRMAQLLQDAFNTRRDL